MAYADKERLTSLAQGIRDRLLIKDKTEAQALVLSVTYPNCIYYTSDTHCIIVGGQVYGRSNQVSADAPFAYLPAVVPSPAADPQFSGNHDTIYIQPIKTGADAGKIKLWWYVNNAWVSSDTLDLVLPTEAEDITYDLTNTPDLGSGDVQSAIEALDGKVEEVKEDVVRTGYLITSWEDDKIQTSTTYAVGSIVGEWGNGVRYGCRGVRLNVKEGDKVLLDTYSPALFGLIFTDENRVVKALYDDRRFDGVWTAPCDGYCYIQDVLYRENYHYSSAHGYLAYMAHDARKRVAKGGDWYNELAPRRTNEALPIEVDKTGNAQTYITGDDNQASWVGIDVGKFVLVATRFYTYADSAMAGTTLVTAGWHNSTANAAQVMSGGSSAYISDGYNWGYRIYLIKTNATGQTIYQSYWNTSSTEKNHHRIDKAYMHSFDNFADAYQLAEKIVHGEVEVDNFYGVKEKEVDFVKNAIGLQSISDLGYNILDHGATLPIDEDGYKYAKEIYERYKDNPPSGQNAIGLFQNDLNLVYLPTIDFSHLQEVGSDYIKEICNGCHNLVCVDDIKLPETSTGRYNNYLNKSFYNCFSLKYVGDISIPNNKVFGTSQVFENCYALEYIGRIHGEGASVLYPAGFKNCYSLKRIEEFPFLNIQNPPNNDGFLNCVNLEYLFCKDFGKSSTMTAYGTFQRLGKWGINSEENPDARQSLVDSLLTYSYDRVNDPDELGTAGTTCTITLSANSYAQLTASEIEQITAKGYTLTHP